jgi:hypothetical protein
MIDERTVRNLIHSDLVAASNVDSLVMCGIHLLGAVFDGAGREVHEYLFE